MFLDCYNILMLKIKKYYFNIFLNKKIFSKIKFTTHPQIDFNKI